MVITTATHAPRERRSISSYVDIEPNKFIQGSLEVTAQGLIQELEESPYRVTASTVGKSNVVHYDGPTLHAARVITTDFPDYDPHHTSHVLVLRKTEGSMDFDQLVIVDLSLGGALTVLRKAPTGSVSCFTYRGHDKKTKAIKMDPIQAKGNQRPSIIQTVFEGEIGGSISSQWKNLGLSIDDIWITLASQDQLLPIPLSWVKSFDGGLGIAAYLSEAKDIARLLPQGLRFNSQDKSSVIHLSTNPGTYVHDSSQSDTYFAGAEIGNIQQVYKWGDKIAPTIRNQNIPPIDLPRTNLLMLGLLSGGPKRRLFSLSDTLNLDLTEVGQNRNSILQAVVKAPVA